MKHKKYSRRMFFQNFLAQWKAEEIEGQRSIYDTVELDKEPIQRPQKIKCQSAPNSIPTNKEGKPC